MLEDTFETEAEEIKEGRSSSTMWAREGARVLRVERAGEGPEITSLQDAREVMRSGVERQIIRAATASAAPGDEARALAAATLALRERRRDGILDRLYAVACSVMGGARG